MIKQIVSKMEATLQKERITAEVTFFNDDGFSVCCDDAEQFARMKAIMLKIKGVTFTEEDTSEPEIGLFAYFTF